MIYILFLVSIGHVIKMSLSCLSPSFCLPTADISDSQLLLVICEYHILWSYRQRRTGWICTGLSGMTYYYYYTNTMSNTNNNTGMFTTENVYHVKITCIGKGTDGDRDQGICEFLLWWGSDSECILT